MISMMDSEEIEGRICPIARTKEFVLSLYSKANPVYNKKTKIWKDKLSKELDKKGYSDLEKKFILAEFDFAKDFHKGEKRRGNKEYYLIHPLEVVLGSKFYDGSGKLLTRGVLNLDIKPNAVAAALAHDTLESALERHKKIPKKEMNKLFRKEHKKFFLERFTEREYDSIKKHIDKVEKLVIDIFTFDKKNDHYFSYIEKFFNKKNFKFTKDRPKRKILRDMLEAQIVKAYDKSVSNYELLNQRKLAKIKSAYKTIYTGNRLKSGLLRNKKKLLKEQFKQGNVALEDLIRSTISAVNGVMGNIYMKYEKEKNNHMLSNFGELEILANKYEKEKGFNEITMPNKNAKWNELEVFDGILYNMYKFITSEKQKAMRAYFENIKNEQERHIKIFTYALSLKYLAEKLDNPNFVVHKFNYRYFQKIDEKGVNNYSNYEKKPKNENMAASYYNKENKGIITTN